MERVARRAQRVVLEDQAVARVLFDQLARREMMLEVDDHVRPSRRWDVFIAYVAVAVILHGNSGILSTGAAIINSGHAGQSLCPGMTACATRATLRPCRISCRMSPSRSPSAQSRWYCCLVLST